MMKGVDAGFSTLTYGNWVFQEPTETRKFLGFTSHAFSGVHDSCISLTPLRVTFISGVPMLDLEKYDVFVLEDTEH